MENISSISLPTIKTEFYGFNNLVKSIDNVHEVMATISVQYQKAMEAIQPSLIALTQQLGDISAQMNTSFSFVAKVINELQIPKIVFPSDSLGWQDVTNNEVQNPNQIIESPLFTFDSNFYEERFDDFKRKSYEHSNTNQFKVFTHYLVLLLTFLKRNIVAEILSVLLWNPTVGYLWQGATHLFYWLMKLLN